MTTSIREKEESMEKAALKLGEAMYACSQEDKELLRQLKANVENFAVQQEKEGKFIDKSSLYALSIVLDEKLGAIESLAQSAKEYVDAEYEYIKGLKTAVQEK